jgi:hypothetical protein
MTPDGVCVAYRLAVKRRESMTPLHVLRAYQTGAIHLMMGESDSAFCGINHIDCRLQTEAIDIGLGHIKTIYNEREVAGAPNETTCRNCKATGLGLYAPSLTPGELQIARTELRAINDPRTLCAYRREEPGEPESLSSKKNRTWRSKTILARS